MSWLTNISQILMVVVILLIPYFIWTFIRRSVRNYMELKEEELDLQRENNELLRRLNGLPAREHPDTEEDNEQSG
ncbi:YebO-like protein [Anseongella ginsenosidimutans]|uniref:YebO-like protein n=1 Tax=Anseongella ginsenosidimutans TaxID=496056 RepID=A0A4V2UU55_9SPHI|nr:YebO family protein [Anseongella ginsenosidimutans]QEC51765.1 hypothetical protein FRZ59_05040 [Anseongella ginsenosidimutans]TCS89133.1 YebO-like protein [Anseongella ginsenosidimutans]